MYLIFLFISFFSFAQFEALKRMPSKQLVAIGESGHGVAEFHNWRGKMSRYLIEKKGFRNILIEDDIIPLFKIFSAIDSCRNPDVDLEKVKRSFLNLNTETYRHNEFFIFYQFLCDWNRTHPSDPVRLSGVDVWDLYWDFRKYLESFFLVLDIEDILVPFNEAKQQCYLWSATGMSDYRNSPGWIYYNKYKRVEPVSHANCLAALHKLINNVNLNKEVIIKKLSSSEFYRISMVLDTARTVQNIVDAFAFNFPKAMGLRDAAQARNILHQLKVFDSQSPVIFLAHNLHVFTRMSQVIPREISSPYPWSNVVSAGEWLKAHFGEKMAVIGMGGYDLKSSRDGQYPIPVSARSLDAKLHGEGHKVLLTIAPKGEWWVHNETEQDGLWIKPKDQFDYYFFINKSGPATLFELETNLK